MSQSLLPELKTQQDFWEFVNPDTHYEGVTTYEFDPIPGDDDMCVFTVTTIGEPRKAKCPWFLGKQQIQIMQNYSPMAAKVGDGPVFVTQVPDDKEEAAELVEVVKKMKQA